jgi:Tfp pilus assembly protein PilF
MRHPILRTLAVTSLCVCSTAAWAKPNANRFASTFDDMTLEGTVEVPLYDFPGYEMIPVVAAQVGDTRVFLALLPGSDNIALRRETVEALELDSRDQSEFFATGTIDQLSVGGLVLTDVEYITGSEPEEDEEATLERWKDLTSVGRTQVLDLDGTIGLGAFPDLAWAVVPSAGVARFTRAVDGNGEALVTTVGTPVAIPEGSNRTSASKFSVSGKVRIAKDTGWTGSSLGTFATLNGEPVRVGLSFGRGLHDANPDHVPDAVIDSKTNGLRTGPLTVELAGETIDTRTIWDHGLSALQDFLGDDSAFKVYVAHLGASVLGQFDVARNNRTGAISFKRFTENNRHDPVPLLLADAEAALKTAMETPPDAEEEVQKDTSLPAGTGATWTAVAKAKEAAGDIPGALEAWQTAAQFEPHDCGVWNNYGLRILKLTRRPSDAKEAFTKASSLYHGWWDWAPETRTALSEILVKADEEGSDYYFQPEDIDFVEVAGIREHDVAMGAPAPLLPETGALIKAQPDTCEVADGFLARIALLEGDLEAVETAYRETFDLHPYVADLQGTAAILRGEPQKAQEAIRQAILREAFTGPFGHRRAVLARAFIDQGDRESADKLLERAVDLNVSFMVLQQWVDNSIELRGLPKTAAAAEALAMKYPTIPSLQLAWLSLVQQTGNPTKIETATARATAAVEYQQMHFSNWAGTHAYAALLALAQGDLDTAEALAAKAYKMGPQYGGVWAIAAEVAKAQGDEAGVQRFTLRAAQASPMVVEFMEKVLADSDSE